MAVPQTYDDYTPPAYGQDLQPDDAEYDQEESEAAHSDALDNLAAQRGLMERYGLKIGTLCNNYAQDNSDLDDLDNWSDEAGAALDAEVLEEDSLLEEDEEDEELDEDAKYERAQLDFHFSARRRYELERAQDVAFELHHRHMETSVNPYATTNAFAELLEVMSQNDDMAGPNPVSSIPLWMRAHFVMEESFEEFNDEVRLLSTGVSQMQAGEERRYNQFLDNEDDTDTEDEEERMARPPLVLEEPEDILEGPGDRLDPLLNVLPGVDKQQSAEVEDYVDELMQATKLPEDASDEDADTGADLNDIDF